MYSTEEKILQPSKLSVIRDLFGTASLKESSVVNYDRSHQYVRYNSGRNSMAEVWDYEKTFRSIYS